MSTAASSLSLSQSQLTDTPSDQFDVVKATQYGKLDRCQELLDQGFDVNQRDAENITLLHWAAINSRKDISKLYLDRGAIVDSVGGELSSTPLHWATRQGHLTMVVLLMKHGADPSLRDGEGCSAIHLAAQFGYTSIVAYLLAKGVSPDIQDRNGLTPLMWAVARVHSYDPARLLITFGANTSIQDKIRQNTVFHWAIQSKNATAVQLLSKKNVSLYIPNNEGDTAYTLLKKIKTNDWIDKKTISKIIERSDAQSTGRGVFNVYRRDKKFRFWGTACMPFIVIYLIGLTFSADISLMLKALFFVVGFVGFRAFGQLVCDERFMNIFPLSVYLSTKMWMYFVWFYYMSPIVPFSTTFLMVSISSLLWYNFLRAWLGDPGRIDIPIYERQQTIIDLAEEDNFDPKNFCTTCLIRKPIRSKHCAICDKCVARFDHHCPWLSNCVGWKNHKYFIGYLFTLVVTCLMYIYGAFQFWSLNCGLEETPWAIVSATVCNPWVSFMTSQAAIHAFWVFILLICQLYQILWLGITTNERINYNRYTYFRNGGRRNGQLINNGFVNNMIDYFELNCFRRETIDWMRAYPAAEDLNQGGEDQAPLLGRNKRDNFQYV